MAGDAAMRLFMREALPHAADALRERARDLITTTLSAVGKDFSKTPRSPEEIEAYAEAMADMLCGYLGQLGSA